MRVTRIYCDRCRKEVKGHPVKIVPEYAYRPEDEFSADGKAGTEGEVPCQEEQADRDYCKACVEQIFAYVNGTGEAADAQPSPEAPKEKPKGRPSVDIGKILALQKAGWKLGDIADEMKMTEKAVRCALWRHKKKQEESAV